MLMPTAMAQKEAKIFILFYVISDYFKRSFSYIASSFWNELPTQVKKYLQSSIPFNKSLSIINIWFKKTWSDQQVKFYGNRFTHSFFLFHFFLFQ